MNILYLGPEREWLTGYLSATGHHVVRCEDPISNEMLDRVQTEFIISYGYRHLVKKDVLDRFPKKIINMHISYLPYNRGADPNLWSFLEDTPKGVTIHYMDQGIDTGDIIAQSPVSFDGNETLRSSYDKLSKEMERLFIETWPNIMAGRVRGIPQRLEEGTMHYKRDKEPFLHLLRMGWDTPVSELIGRASRHGRSN